MGVRNFSVIRSSESIKEMENLVWRHSTRGRFWLMGDMDNGESFWLLGDMDKRESNKQKAIGNGILQRDCTSREKRI
jgi:hypothetical protein